MKIALDAQLLFEKQKTGIGWNTKMMIDHLIQYTDIEWTLNYFWMRDKNWTEEVIADYRNKGCILHQSKWLPARIYNHLERIIPFPYQLVFGRKAELTQFFNYTLPFGVSGKKLTFIHDMAYKAYPETLAKRTLLWLETQMPKYCKRADIIVTISEFSKQEIHRYLGIPLEKIKVVYCGVDLEKYRPDYSTKEIEQAKQSYNISGKYLLYLGTLEPRKNIESLVIAYAKLKQEMSDVPKLVLSGKKGWLYDSIFDLVQQNNLADDVIFTGYVDTKDAAPLTCGAEIFLFPSLYEGFGIPPLEAMACGTPVITSNVASLPEVVGSAGITVSPKDTEELKNGIKAMLTNGSMRKEFISAGIKRAQEFTWARSAETLVNIYRDLYQK